MDLQRGFLCNFDCKKFYSNKLSLTPNGNNKNRDRKPGVFKIMPVIRPERHFERKVVYGGGQHLHFTGPRHPESRVKVL